MLQSGLMVLSAYLIGSVPTGYIFARVLKKIDIREHGSGNVGATNVFRTVGKIPGIIVLVIDFLKGFIAVALLPLWADRAFPGSGEIHGANILIAIGIAAIAGHMWTVFLKFRGGKGVATTAGVMAALAPMVLLSSLLVWILIFSIWRYVSLASIVAATALPFFAAILGKDLHFVVFCSLLAGVGIYGHRSNIKRLILGQEKKLV